MGSEYCHLNMTKANEKSMILIRPCQFLIYKLWSCLCILSRATGTPWRSNKAKSLSGGRCIDYLSKQFRASTPHHSLPALAESWLRAWEQDRYTCVESNPKLYSHSRRPSNLLICSPSLEFPAYISRLTHKIPENPWLASHSDCSILD